MGISDYEGEEFCTAMKRDEIAMIRVTPPVSILFPHRLLRYFYNSVSSDPENGLYLEKIPQDEKKCYGNSWNWADYILMLSHEEQLDLLDNLRQAILK